MNELAKCVSTISQEWCNVCKDHFAGAEVVEGHVADPQIGHDTGAVHQAAARAVVLAREENVGQLAQRQQLLQKGTLLFARLHCLSPSERREDYYDEDRGWDIEGLHSDLAGLLAAKQKPVSAPALAQSLKNDHKASRKMRKREAAEAAGKLAVVVESGATSGVATGAAVHGGLATTAAQKMAARVADAERKTAQRKQKRKAERDRLMAALPVQGQTRCMVCVKEFASNEALRMHILDSNGIDHKQARKTPNVFSQVFAPAASSPTSYATAASSASASARTFSSAAIAAAASAPSPTASFVAPAEVTGWLSAALLRPKLAVLAAVPGKPAAPPTSATASARRQPPPFKTQLCPRWTRCGVCINPNRCACGPKGK